MIEQMSISGAIEVYNFRTREVVETIDVSDQSDRNVDRILSGLLHQMDRTEFSARVVERTALEELRSLAKQSDSADARNGAPGRSNRPQSDDGERV